MTKFGPTKVSVKGDALYEARTGKLIKDGLATPADIIDYAAHHYIALPVMDNAGRPWSLDGKLVYCLRGSKYETLDDDLPHARPCPECGGLALPIDEGTVERDCMRCTLCSQEFDARLEMMES
jgi:hypothetical protein